MTDSLPPDLAQRWAAFEDEAGPTLVDAMSNESPVATGQLAASHSYRDDGSGSVLEVVSTDDRGPIAAYVIRGTAPHPIDPVTARALHWVDASGFDVFASHVDHPGTAPNPYNVRAWEDVRDIVLASFARTVGVGYVVAYLNPWTREPL